MREAGYTLIEVIVMVLLLSIIGLIALPAVQKVYSRFVLEETAWRMARELRQAQQLALAREEWFHIQFQYTLDRYVVSNSEGIWNVVELPLGIVMEPTTFSRNEVFFYPSGAPSMGGTIPLINQNGKKRYVKVTVAAGRVRVGDER